MRQIIDLSSLRSILDSPTFGTARTRLSMEGRVKRFRYSEKKADSFMGVGGLKTTNRNHHGIDSASPLRGFFFRVFGAMYA